MRKTSYRKESPPMSPGSTVPPKLANSVRKVNLIAPEDLLAKIDQWRRNQPGLPNRSEAIRKLIEAGLDAMGKGTKKPKA
jgi:hypothetical protein